ncbi:hypothetical protein BURKHO8Y_240246 [Burkholderia sp. 8Y]|uniref:hypothetical protein n=1 Tax=Burkholderia sp. 8Y TaxID=2653133 RepID=UPI0012F30A71|nr:hypothetical protein [Burkholderia sp. 8Y]VXC60525.1 hypothetical protein BURKHO8Y_240246 [Burkholderia sp. 8Y]
MSDNDSVFSGLSARPSREIVEALQAWREPHGYRAHTYQLAGAVMSLAHTVEEQRRDIAKLNRLSVAAGRVAERKELPDEITLHATDPEHVRAASAEERVYMLYAALEDLLNMARLGLGSSLEERYDNSPPAGALRAMEARLRLMLQAAGRLPY